MTERERKSTRKPKIVTPVTTNDEPTVCDICEGSGFADDNVCGTCNGSGYEQEPKEETDTTPVTNRIKAQTLLKWHSLISALCWLGIVGVTLFHLSRLPAIRERTREVYGGSNLQTKIKELTELMTTNTSYQVLVGCLIVGIIINAWRFAILHKEEREGLRL